MTKLWLFLGMTGLLASIAIFLDQGLRYGVWWEWEDFLHHETFIVIFSYGTLILLTVALVEHIRNLKRKRKQGNESNEGSNLLPSINGRPGTRRHEP